MARNLTGNQAQTLKRLLDMLWEDQSYPKQTRDYAADLIMLIKQAEQQRKAEANPPAF